MLLLFYSLFLLHVLVPAFAQFTTVSNFDQLQTALNQGQLSIKLTVGTFTVPSGQQLKVASQNVVITGAGPSTVITCGGSTNNVAFQILSDMVTISNLAIIRCGWAVQVAAKNADLSFLSIANNSNVMGYGAVHVMNTGSVIIGNTGISYNNAKAAVLSYGYATVKSSSISGNQGGGVLASSGGVVTVMDSNIAMNYGSGAYAEKGSTLDIRTTSILNNYGAVNGGGIGAADSSVVSVDLSTITGNTVTKDGCGIWVSGGSLKVIDSEVNNNACAASSDLMHSQVFATQAAIVDSKISNGAPSYCCQYAVVCNYPVAPCQVPVDFDVQETVYSGSSCSASTTVSTRVVQVDDQRSPCSNTYANLATLSAARYRLLSEVYGEVAVYSYSSSDDCDSFTNGVKQASFKFGQCNSVPGSNKYVTYNIVGFYDINPRP